MRMIKRFLVAAALVAGAGAFSSASAELCYLCGSGSRCEQCRAGGSNDTQDARKACEARGCKVSGYTSCSGAVNIKMCHVQKEQPKSCSR